MLTLFSMAGKLSRLNANAKDWLLCKTLLEQQRRLIEVRTCNPWGFLSWTRLRHVPNLPPQEPKGFGVHMHLFVMFSFSPSLIPSFLQLYELLLGGCELDSACFHYHYYLANHCLSSCF